MSSVNEASGSRARRLAFAALLVSMTGAGTALVAAAVPGPAAVLPTPAVAPSTAAAVLPMSATAPSTAAAAPWSLEGHDIVCEIAFQRLSSEARDMIFEIRAHDPQPSDTFFDSCSWPDSSRYGDHKATYEYHFMNVVIPDAEEMVMQRDCANYDCVQVAIVRYAHYTAMDPQGSESMQVRRANALKFLGHFVGDLHQPVHVGYAHDRGGNDVLVDFYDESDERMHAIWDFHIPNRMGFYDDPAATARRLNDEITAQEAAAWEDFDVVAWSRESYEVVKELVYDIPADGRLGDDYFDRAVPIVEQRFKQAGVRLAFLLNHAATGTLDFAPLFED